MIASRSLFASVLLTAAVLGTVVAPAVHWAGHGLEAHEAPIDGTAYAAAAGELAHTGECPDCAHLQKVLGSEPSARPFYAGVVGLARSAPPPEVPAVQTDVATPEGRGPPTAA